MANLRYPLNAPFPLQDPEEMNGPLPFAPTSFPQEAASYYPRETGSGLELARRLRLHQLRQHQQKMLEASLPATNQPVLEQQALRIGLTPPPTATGQGVVNNAPRTPSPARVDPSQGTFFLSPRGTIRNTHDNYVPEDDYEGWFLAPNQRGYGTKLAIYSASQASGSPSSMPVHSDEEVLVMREPTSDDPPQGPLPWDLMDKVMSSDDSDWEYMTPPPMNGPTQEVLGDQPGNFMDTTSVTEDELTERQRKDEFLVEKRKLRWSYRRIKEAGKFKEAEATLRGRHRELTKPKEERVRKPEWQASDVSLTY